MRNDSPAPVLAAHGASDSRLAWHLPVLLGAAFSVLYLLTQVGNVGDTDDVYYFAYLIENFPINYVGDPRLLLYKSSMQWAYHALHLLGWSISGLELLRGFSALCGGAALAVLWWLLERDLGVTRRAALAAVVLLGASYGFWRYAIEAEVYVPSTLLLLIALRWFYRLERRPDSGAVALLPLALFSGAAVLFYQPNVIPLALAFLLLNLRQTRCCGLMVYAGVAAAVVIGGYWIGYVVYKTHPLGLATFEEFLRQRSLEFVVWPFDLRNFIQATLGGALILWHDILSSNWIFAHDWIGQDVQRMFAYEWFFEKQYTARQAGWLAVAPLVLIPLVTLLGIWVLVRAYPYALARVRDRRVGVYVAWLLVSGLIIWRLNPYGPEAWIMLLTPLMIVLAVVVIEPAIQRGGGRIVAWLVVGVAAHNAIGGIAIIHDSLSEYAVAKTQWVLENAAPKDVVLVVDDNPLFMTLNYRANAIIVPLVLEATPVIAEALVTGRWRVRLASELSKDFRVVVLADLFRETLANGHRIIFPSDFFEGSRRRQFESINLHELDMLDRLRSQLTPVWSAPELGTLYVLDKPLVPAR